MTDRTANANLAPRCQHTKLNGSPCAAPARRARKYCVFHEAAHATRPDYTTRLVEDAMSLQLSLFHVMRALDNHDIDPRRAALKLYALQIAASNLKRLHEETREIGATRPDDEPSLMRLFLDRLHIPESPEELAAEFAAEAEARDNSARTAPSFADPYCSAPSHQPPATNYPIDQSEITNASAGRTAAPRTFDIEACAEDAARPSDLPLPTFITRIPNHPITRWHPPGKNSTAGEGMPAEALDNPASQRRPLRKQTGY